MVTKKAGYEVLKAVIDYCVAHSIPSPDRGAKSIVGEQALWLTKHGWPLAEVKAEALELASQYTRWQGHRSLLALQRILELKDEDRAYAAHRLQKDKDRKPIDARVAAIIGPAWTREERRRRHPSKHDFRDDGRGSCAECAGPVGVHVRFANVPDLEKEAMERMAREREARRPLRKLGGTDGIS